MKASTKEIITNLLSRYVELQSCSSALYQAVQVMSKCFQGGHKLLVCGNGGSAADSEHIVGELMKGFLLPRKIEFSAIADLKDRYPEHAEYYAENLQRALPAISLVNQVALTSAYANDKVPDLIFAQQVFGIGKEGDVLLAISTSGNSKNVLYAAEIAKVKKMNVISLTGNSGGKLKLVSDVLINVEETKTYIIQEYHLPIYHALCIALENEFFGGDE